MITIRQGGTDDLVQAMNVMARAFDPRFGEAWTKDQCLGLLSLPHTVLMIGKHSDATAGFAIARTVLDEVELMLLAVLPECQNAGLGANLLLAIEKWGISLGANRIFLEVRSGNPARQFYSRLGFLEIGSRKDYYRGANGERNDAITLGKSLD